VAVLKTKLPGVRCSVCTIIIGKGYSQTEPQYIGKKPVCGSCFSIAQKQNGVDLEYYPTLHLHRKLLLDGTITYISD
jgi:hypothetical protein